MMGIKLNLHSALHKSVSNAPLVVFRIIFGVLMFTSMIRFAAKGWIHDLYVAPEFLFAYRGFEWLPRPDGFWIYILFVVTAAAALGIALGSFYRWSATLFFLGFTYIELLDKANYLNHYYFVSLMAFILIWLPAHRSFSLDVKWQRIAPNHITPAWTILAPQFLLGIVYFFAGVAKLNAEWLLNANPLRIWLPQHADLPLIGSLLTHTWVAYVLSWCGALYDLSIVFLLWNRRTRPYAYVAVIVFHVFTATLFPIGMFPLIMMACTLVFFSPQFHERILELLGHKAKGNHEVHSSQSRFPRLVTTGFIIFFAVQLLLPLRSHLLSDNVYWTEEGYRFSWRVMLMEKAGKTFFYVSDKNQPGEQEIYPGCHLTLNQEKMMSTQPDMILQYAHYLRKQWKQQGLENPCIRAESWVSLNGKGSRLLLDPLVDLGSTHYSMGNNRWILPFDSVVTSAHLAQMRLKTWAK